MSHNTSCQTMTPIDFAVFLIAEAEKINRQGLGIMNTQEWIIQKWHQWAPGAGYPKPWPFILKPLLTYRLDLNSSAQTVKEVNE